MTDYSDLIERVGKAEGPDRNLDGAIYWHLLEENRAERELWWVEIQFAATPENGDWRKPYTASLDAALSLVDQFSRIIGWQVANRDGHYDASVWLSEADPLGPRTYEAEAPTPALAVIAALLRALEEKGKA